MNKNAQEPELDWTLVSQAIARLRASVMAIVIGLVSGTGLFIATAWLVIRGGNPVGQTLGLLRHYLPGYSVTWPGAFLGFVYAAVLGAITGWVVAFIYNQVVALRHEGVSKTRGSPTQRED